MVRKTSMHANRQTKINFARGMYIYIYTGVLHGCVLFFNKSPTSILLKAFCVINLHICLDQNV